MKRIKILERDNYECRLCGDGGNFELELHHLTPFSNGGNNDINNLITLCKSCHLFMHCNPKLVMKQHIKHKERINAGLDRAKKEGKTLGRPKGKKDGKVRRKSGYYMRWKK